MFKRVRQELEKQQIVDTEFDVNDKEEKLAGVFSESESDSDSDPDNSDDEQTKRYKKRAYRKL